MAASTTSGHYTAEQGSRGAEVFGAHCGSCHIEREFSGRLFAMSWSGKSLFEFYDFLRTAMPYDDPGSLTAQEYTDIVAFILQNNGYSIGGSELPSRPDALSAISFN
jgi:mono/diheme cytochrome c family protein